jgi:hypothetical protein
LGSRDASKRAGDKKSKDFAVSRLQLANESFTSNACHALRFYNQEHLQVRKLQWITMKY